MKLIRTSLSALAVSLGLAGAAGATPLGGTALAMTESNSIDLLTFQTTDPDVWTSLHRSSDSLPLTMTDVETLQKAGIAEGSLIEMMRTRRLLLVADADTIKDGEGQVRLMTIHTAKGLEFPVVVLAGCEDDILPHINSAMEEAGLEEERRLFYVALTRAEKRVYLLHAMRRRRFGTWQDGLPSRFLSEVPEELIERRRLNLGHAGGPGATRSLFSGSGGGGFVERGAARRPGDPVKPTTWSGGSSRAWTGGAGTGGGSQGASPTRRVSPHEWGSSNRPKPGARPSATHDEHRQESWDDDVAQEAPYFEGQTVSHGIFGTGTVARVEGTGEDLQVTVDFADYGRKHLNPKFAPLMPLD